MRDDDLWLEKYNLAKEYFEVNGSLKMPVNYTVNGVKLDSWLKYQKRRYIIGRLSEEKIYLLNKIGIVWKSRNVYSWEYKYNLAKEYYVENGNLLIPRDYVMNKDGEKINLETWVLAQRNLYKKGNLSEEKVLLLEDIGIAWRLFKSSTLDESLDIESSDMHSLRWTRVYNLAKEYYIENGDLLMPSDYKVALDGKTIRLDAWLCNQRRFYKKGKLSQNRIKLLEDIGIAWNFECKQNIIWKQRYDLAKKYYEENGNLNVPTGYLTNGVNLYVWIKLQKNEYLKGNLSDEQISLLNEIGMVWNVHFSKWLSFYKLAKEYYEKNGNLLIPFDYIINDRKLGSWVIVQRKKYKNGCISRERIEMLNKIGMVWTFDNIRFSAWLEKYEIAKKYYMENGNLLMAFDYMIDGFELGKWVSRQRHLYNYKQLSDEKISLLNEIGMIWEKEDVDFAKWHLFYNLALEYYENNGNLLIPFDYIINDKKLGSWIDLQRMKLNNRNISAEKIEMLNKIGMVWNLEKGLNNSCEKKCTEEEETPIDMSDLNWFKVYKAVCEYFKSNENLLIPDDLKICVDEKDIYLKAWLESQKKLYKLKSLNADRIKLLEDIELINDSVKDPKWTLFYSLAKEYYEVNGNANIPTDYVVMDETGKKVKLGVWLARQIDLYNFNKLSLEKAELLEKLGVRLDVKRRYLRYN